MSESSGIDLQKTDGFREAARARAKSQWTPAARQAQSVLTREKMNRPEIRKHLSDQRRAAIADPDAHKRQVETMRATMARPDVRERISAGTKLGMARRLEHQVNALREAWRSADKRTRAVFLGEIGARLQGRRGDG